MQRFQLGEFWLAQRASGAAWNICWFDKAARQTRRVSTGLRDFEEAKRRLAEHVIQNSKPDSSSPEDVPVSYVLDEYYKGHAVSLPSGEYAKYALGYWRKAFADCAVDALTPARLEELVSSLSSTGSLSPGSVNRILAVGRAALSRAHRRGLLAKHVFVPTVKCPAPKLKRASVADVAALLNATDGDLGHIRTWLLLSIGTLARPEALLELTREQCDFDLGRIDLNQAGRLQSRKVRPIVPMVPTLRPLLERTETGVVTRYRGEPLADVRMGFSRARQRAGLPATITPYTIRRTMASELRRRGVPPWEIAGFLGHSARDYATTEVYAEYAPDYLGAAATAIEAYFEELRPLLDFELPKPALDLPASRKPDVRVGGAVPASASLRAERVPVRVSYHTQLPDFMVGATGIEPATTTMSRSTVGGKISDLRITYSNGEVLGYNELPLGAFHLRSNVRSNEEEL